MDVNNSWNSWGALFATNDISLLEQQNPLGSCLNLLAWQYLQGGGTFSNILDSKFIFSKMNFYFYLFIYFYNDYL